MSDTPKDTADNTPGNGSDKGSDKTGAAADAPALVVNGQYIKDLSFEVPEAPGVLLDLPKNSPQIGVNIDVAANKLHDNTYEAVITVQAECKVGEKTGFALELVYGGVFTLNVAADQVHPMILIECPRILFPFIRNIVSDITRDGGFPPLMLGMVDFADLFRKKIERDGTAEKTSSKTPS